MAAPTAASTYYLSGAGSDRNPGNACRPWRTIRHADRVVEAGDSVYVRGGTYGARGVRATIASAGTAARPIAWAREPGAARPVFHGQLRISGDHNRVSGILFQGPTGSIRGAEEDVVVWLDADGLELEHSEVRDGRGHAGIFVSDSRNFAIRNDYVHRNGNSFNLDQGIYVDSGSGRIQNNVIASNYAWGVQLYPRSAGVTVNHNTIVGNGRGGVIVAADASRSRVANNIVSGNGEYGIYAYDLAGVGNVATNNLLWDQPLNTYGAGLGFGSDLVADPRFVGGLSFQIDAASPAVDAGSAPAVADDFAGAHRLGRADLGAYEYGSPVPVTMPAPRGSSPLAAREHGDRVGVEDPGRLQQRRQPPSPWGQPPHQRRRQHNPAPADLIAREQGREITLLHRPDRGVGGVVDEEVDRDDRPPRCQHAVHLGADVAAQALVENGGEQHHLEDEVEAVRLPRQLGGAALAHVRPRHPAAAGLGAIWHQVDAGDQLAASPPGLEIGQPLPRPTADVEHPPAGERQQPPLAQGAHEAALDRLAHEQVLRLAGLVGGGVQVAPAAVVLRPDAANLGLVHVSGSVQSE